MILEQLGQLPRLSRTKFFHKTAVWSVRCHHATLSRIHDLDRGHFQGVMMQIQIYGVGILHCSCGGLPERLECSTLPELTSSKRQLAGSYTGGPGLGPTFHRTDYRVQLWGCPCLDPWHRVLLA